MRGRAQVALASIAAALLAASCVDRETPPTTPPTATSPPAETDERALGTDTGPERSPAAVDAGLGAEASAGSAHAAPEPPPEIRPGLGTCSTDADCVIGHSIDPAHYGRDACCIRFCSPGGAISDALLEKQSRWRDRNCRHVKCGLRPPRPCPRVDYTLVPRCLAGKCASEVHPRPRRPEPDF